MSPNIGRIRLDELEETDLKDMRETLSTGLAPDGKTPRATGPLAVTTQEHSHRHLKQAVRSTMTGRVRLINFNPAQPEEARPTNGEQKPINPLTGAEVQKLFSATKDDREFPFWMLMVATGMRPGEAQALTSSAIDWERKSVSITGTIHWETARGWFMGRTKTKRNPEVKLRPQTVAVLTAHRAAQEERSNRASALWKEHGFVFTTDTGSPINFRRLQRLLEDARARAGIARRTLKELRHTLATLALLRNVPVNVVSEALGHSGVAITLDIYSHVISGLHEDSIWHLDGLFD